MSEQSQDNSKIFADKEQGSLSPDLEAALREAQAHADELEDNFEHVHREKKFRWIIVANSLKGIVLTAISFDNG